MTDPDLKDSLQAVDEAPIYTGNPNLDRLYDMVLRLTQELAVSREEVSLLRQVLIDQGLLEEEKINLAASSEAFANGQLEQHRAMVAKVLGDLNK